MEAECVEETVGNKRKADDEAEKHPDQTSESQPQTATSQKEIKEEKVPLFSLEEKQEAGGGSADPSTKPMHAEEKEQIWYQKDDESNHLRKAIGEKERLKDDNKRMMDILAEKDNVAQAKQESQTGSVKRGQTISSRQPTRSSISTPAPLRDGVKLRSSALTPGSTTKLRSKTGEHQRRLEQRTTPASLALKRKRHLLSDDDLDLPF